MAAGQIEAGRVVRASPEAVYRFLCRLENHWKLTGRWVEAVAIDDDSGRVRIHGPLGLRRTVSTAVAHTQPEHVIHGTAELSGGTRARIAWELREDAGGTAVRLSAEVDHATLPDRILLAVGGRTWMTRRFDAILARLDEQVA